jgi:hypothetical protein
MKADSNSINELHRSQANRRPLERYSILQRFPVLIRSRSYEATWQPAYTTHVCLSPTTALGLFLRASQRFPHVCQSQKLISYFAL